MGLIQTISLVLEERAKTQLAADMAAAGAKGIAALRQEFQRKMGDLKADFAQGLIDEPTFRAQAKRVADAFNQEVIKRMDMLKAAGKDTSKEYAELGRQIKLASDTGIHGGGLLTSAWGKVKAFAVGMGATIAAAFTVRSLVDFAKESITTAVTVGKSWANISNAVKTAGGDFEALRPTIDATVERISKALAFDDEEVRDGLTRMIRATGSVSLGLRGVEVAAKLARAGQISMQQATDMLTRALETGNVRALTTITGNLKGTKDVLGDVEAALGDVASTVPAFDRGMMALSETWEDFKVALGNALIAGADGASVFDVLTTAVQSLAEWVTRNRDTIAAWAKFIINEFVILGQGIGNTFKGVVAFFNPNSGFWRSIRVGFLQFGQVILGVILKLQNGMLELSRALPGDPFADQIQRAMDRTSGYIGALGTEIAEQSAGMRKDLGADDPGATKTTSLGGGFAANVKAGAGKATGDVQKMSREAKKAAEEMAEAHRRAQAQNLAVTTETQKAIQDAYIQSGEAAERGGIMSQEAARETQETAAEIANAQRNYAEEYWKRDVPLYLQGQQAIQAELDKTKEKGAEAGNEGKKGFDKWLEAMHVLESSLDDLGQTIGGVLGSFVSGIGGVVSGITAAAAGFKAFKESTLHGLAGLIEKAAGLAGGFAGIIGVAAQLPGILKSAVGIIGDILGGIGDVLGLGDSPRELANQESGELYRIAIQPRPSVARTEALNKLLYRSTHLPDELNRRVAAQLYQDALAILAGTQTPEPFAPPTGVPTAPPPTSPVPGGIPLFQHGGWMPHTGLAMLHQNELVLPPRLAADLLSLAGNQGPSLRYGDQTDSRVFNFAINVSGVADQEIPQAIVREVQAALARDYQNAAMLQGNASMR